MKKLLKMSGITIMLLALISLMSCNKTYNTEGFYKKYENNNENVVKTNISNYPYTHDTINKIEYKCVYYSKTIDFKEKVNFCDYLSNDYKLKYDGVFGSLLVKVYVKPIDKYYSEIITWVAGGKNSTDKGETIITYYGFFDDIFISQYTKTVEILEEYINSSKDKQSKADESSFSNNI
jgi:hypothetical protein